MKPIKKFIESNRQTGTSTALIKTVKETGGYLIVAHEEMRSIRIKQNPDLKDHILTAADIKNESYIGIKSRPIFFDTDFVTGLIFNHGMNDLNQEHYSDGYNKNNKQLNIKLTDDDLKDINEINHMFFENEATNSMMGRILVRKGIQFYKTLFNKS